MSEESENEENVLAFEHNVEAGIFKNLATGEEVYLPVKGRPDKIAVMLLSLQFDKITLADAYVAIHELFQESTSSGREEIGKVIGEFLSAKHMEDSGCGNLDCIDCYPVKEEVKH